MRINSTKLCNKVYLEIGGLLEKESSDAWTKKQPG